MAADALDCALDLFRRLPPENVERNLRALVALAPELEADLLSCVDAPLKVATDSSKAGKGRDFLCCDFNASDDAPGAHRSPWSGQFFKAGAELGAAAVEVAGHTPLPDKLRRLEVEANEVWDAYRTLYYEGGVSSVYLWEGEGGLEQGFAGAFLIKKEGGKRMSRSDAGAWDAIHVVEVTEPAPGGDGKATYTLTSTVMLYLRTSDKSGGDFSLAGHITRQAEKRASASKPGESHLINIGSLIEQLEGKLRNSLDVVYFGKTCDVVGDLRTAGAAANDLGPVSIKSASAELFKNQGALIAEMMAKRAGKA